MKFRKDFVTNSSSASYIICFARIEDMEKARPIIEKHSLDVFNVEGVNNEMCWTGELGADWAGATIYSTDKVLSEHPDDNFIIIEECLDADYGEDYDSDPVYDYDFSVNDAIGDITEENGFANIEVAEGEGRNG